LEANNDVPVDRLAQYVWDGTPPAAAQTTLQSYVYRLRRLLCRMADAEILTSSVGYMLRVDPAATDVWLFRQGVSDARDRAVGGDLAHSVCGLRSALALWRGNALAGMAGRLIRREARFLDDERIAAYGDLFN